MDKNIRDRKKFKILIRLKMQTVSFISRKRVLQHNTSDQKPFDHSDSVNLVKYTEPSEYALIVMQLSENGEPQVSNFAFSCPVGSFLGFKVQVHDFTKQEIQYNQLEWTFSTTVIWDLIQTQKKSQAVFILPNQKCGALGPYVEVGWPSPGDFRVTVEAKTASGVLKSEGLITVQKPEVHHFLCEEQDPNFTSHLDSKKLESASFTLRSSLGENEYSGTAGFIQLTSAEGVTQESGINQFETVVSMPSNSQVLQNSKHLKTKGQVETQADNILSIELNSASFPATAVKTYLAFQPDPYYSSMITRTFIVKFNRQHLAWNLSAMTKGKENEWNIQNAGFNQVIATDVPEWDFPLWNYSTLVAPTKEGSTGEI